jgi:hypothetical protein
MPTNSTVAQVASTWSPAKGDIDAPADTAELADLRREATMSMSITYRLQDNTALPVPRPFVPLLTILVTHAEPDSSRQLLCGLL